MGRILVGDVREQLAGLPAESVHAVITSPPYWSLRSYSTEPQVWGGDAACEHEWALHRQYRDSPARTGDEGIGFDNADVTRAQRWTESAFCTRCPAWRGELGSEPTPDLYVAHLAEVFRVVKRVLRQDGSLWINLGSSFAGSWGNQGRKPERGTQRPINGPMLQNLAAGYPTLESHTGTVPAGWKPKDLILTPFMMAEALRRDGWYLRSAVPWVRRNPMPESVTDRPSTALEWMFLLTKAERYFYDAEAIRKPMAVDSAGRYAYAFGGSKNRALVEANQNGIGVRTRPIGMRDATAGRNRRNADWWYESLDALIAEQRAYLAHLERVRERGGVLLDEGGEPLGFDVNPQAYAEAHFATYPEKLVEPCILASTSERGVCGACGAPWLRQVERGALVLGSHKRPTPTTRGDARRDPMLRADKQPTNDAYFSMQTTGWLPSCACDALTRPATVLDPFLGSGTTGAVAERLGRDWVGVELNESYAELARKRTAQRGFGALLAETGGEE